MFCSLILPRAGEIKAPVPDVEYSENEGKEDSGEHVNLLGLELKVLEPHEKFVRLSDRQPGMIGCQYFNLKISEFTCDE